MSNATCNYQLLSLSVLSLVRMSGSANEELSLDRTQLTVTWRWWRRQYNMYSKAGLCVGAGSHKIYKSIFISHLWVQSELNPCNNDQSSKILFFSKNVVTPTWQGEFKTQQRVLVLFPDNLISERTFQLLFCSKKNIYKNSFPENMLLTDWEFVGGINEYFSSSTTQWMKSMWGTDINWRVL